MSLFEPDFLKRDASKSIAAQNFNQQKLLLKRLDPHSLARVATSFFLGNRKFCAGQQEGSTVTANLTVEPTLRAKLPIEPFKNRPRVF